MDGGLSGDDGLEFSGAGPQMSVCRPWILGDTLRPDAEGGHESEGERAEV